jgi:hypothetical protein
MHFHPFKAFKKLFFKRKKRSYPLRSKKTKRCCQTILPSFHKAFGYNKQAGQIPASATQITTLSNDPHQHTSFSFNIFRIAPFFTLVK